MTIPFISISKFVLQNKYRPLTLQRNDLKYIIKGGQASIRPMRTYSKSLFFNSFCQQINDSVPFIKTSVTLLLWAEQIHLIPRFLKSSSVNVVRNCLEQVEFVLAYRIRRGQQMISLYTRMWDERNLKQFFHLLRRMFQKRNTSFIFGSTLLAFDWDKERISEAEITKHLDELAICHALRMKAADKQGLCTGKECRCPECDSFHEDVCWEPFIQEENLTVWKMEETSHKGQGLFCYKVFGRYTDVTANDFLEVFLDIENRTKWDSHAATLKIIDTEKSSNSDIIYWETKWPTFFSNRDYVFKRRYYKDENSKVIIVMNRSTEHPLYPPVTSKSRVTEYWSYMVIKSQQHDFEKPGIEFSLTYFDNPGIALPSSISLWVTVQGMPEYLKRLRKEALEIRNKRLIEEAEKIESLKSSGESEPPSSEGPYPDFDPAFILGLLSSYMNKLKQPSL